MTDLTQRIQTLCQALPDLEWITAPMQLKRLSRDFHWFSPILKDSLDKCLADLGVRPRSEAELLRIVSACAEHGVPVTLRGGGSGNYGQAVPLHGGLVIELTALDKVRWVREGVARAQCGIRLAALEDALHPQGWELRCMPSTYRIATLGGLFGGGFGGIGSINYGPLAATGTVLGARVMTLEYPPRIVELRAPEVMQLNHVYGTNGIVLELEIALAPAQHWDEYLLGFDSTEAAFACAEELATTPSITKRNVALFEAAVARYFNALDSVRQPEEAVLICALAPQAEQPLKQILLRHGGRICQYHSAAEVAASGHTLLEYCWNHTTLHALKHDRSLTYLQTAYVPGQTWAQLQRMSEVLEEDEVLTHLEFIRDGQGRSVAVGLPLVRYQGAERLNQIIALHRANGVQINDPHVFTLEDGKHGGALDPAILARKHDYDPAGLLNPGKVRSWSTQQ